jgi:hypothetical protein
LGNFPADLLILLRDRIYRNFGDTAGIHAEQFGADVGADTITIAQLFAY